MNIGNLKGLLEEASFDDKLDSLIKRLSEDSEMPLSTERAPLDKSKAKININQDYLLQTTKNKGNIDPITGLKIQEEVKTMENLKNELEVEQPVEGSGEEKKIVVIKMSEPKPEEDQIEAEEPVLEPEVQANDKDLAEEEFDMDKINESFNDILNILKEAETDEVETAVGEVEQLEPAAEEVEMEEKEEVVEEMPAEVESIEVESSSEPEIMVGDDKIVIEIPAVGKISAPEGEAMEELQEAIKTIFRLISKSTLNEEETVEVPEDAEAEIEIEDGKLIVTIPTAATKEEVSQEEGEAIYEAISVIARSFLKEEDVVKAPEQPKPADESPEDHTPEADNEDVFPAEEHQEAEEVEAPLIEGEEVPAPEQPEAANKTPKEHTPKASNADVVSEPELDVKSKELGGEPTDARVASVEVSEEEVTGESQDAEEVEAPLIESEHQELHSEPKEDIEGEQDEEGYEAPEVKEEDVTEELESVDDIELKEAEEVPAPEQPKAADETPEDYTPEADNEDVFPAEEHDETEEVEAPLIEKAFSALLNSSQVLVSNKGNKNGKLAINSGFTFDAVKAARLLEAFNLNREEKLNLIAEASTRLYVQQTKTLIEEAGFNTSTKGIKLFAQSHNVKLTEEEAEELASEINKIEDIEKMEKYSQAVDELQVEAPEVENADVAGEPEEELEAPLIEGEEVDHEGQMAKIQLKKIIANAQKLHDMLDDASQLPAWVQSKITLADHNIEASADYHHHTEEEGMAELSESQEAEHQEVNNAGSDVLDQHGEIKEVSPEGSEKAEPEDVTVEDKSEELPEAKEYHSLKEAFLLEADYFETDSVERVTAKAKQAKLIEQISLLIAKESNDPLYEELLETAVVAKRLQENIKQKHYGKAHKKANEMIEFKKKK